MNVFSTVKTYIRFLHYEYIHMQAGIQILDDILKYMPRIHKRSRKRQRFPGSLMKVGIHRNSVWPSGAK